ncbi:MULTISPECIES: hypothetical protein [unclassified Acinetobacter]|uniref:hypothetical protein n=1 Tax=unclassified Acinetobacter TaxID=196816 RepID=UPI00140A5A34|nr:MULTISPECIES: hypothetical protein [unclassified Acinetobacter]NHB64046.1 hypothetical protein [Acinetobacter sp. GFQ9D191M]NHB99666.1 hypothetical protein [Acinetobacter sp. GFQ9D192M]
MDIASQKTTEKFGKIPNLFKSKFLFFFLGFWLMTTAFYYAGVVPSDDYSVISKALLLLALISCFLGKR